MKRPPNQRIDFRPAGRGSWAGIALFATGLAAAAGSLQWYGEIGREIELLEAGVSDIRRMTRRSMGEFTESSRDPKALQQEIRAANDIIRQMTVPWEALFRELEYSAGKGVALLSLQPDLQNRLIRISGEARDLDEIFAYTQRLGESELLGRVHLTEHAVKLQDPQKPVAFSLTAQWTAPQ